MLNLDIRQDVLQSTTLKQESNYEAEELLSFALHLNLVAHWHK